MTRTDINRKGLVTMQTKAVTAERTMYYGKKDVFVYRTYASPLQVQPIPESSFTGRSNTIMAMDIQAALKGKAFLSSFKDGDNSLVIATDSMKNFILHQAGEFTGSTMDDLLQYTAVKFLETYDHIQGVEMSGTQLPFKESGEDGAAETVYREHACEKPYAAVEAVRREDGTIVLEEHVSGVTSLHLIKVKGSSFAGFIRDEYTTLPETTDRPLFIYLDIFWRYSNKNHMRENYAAAEQIQHIAESVFRELDSPSIQKLIFDIGCRILKRFPQLAEVSFESNNRTWETIREEIPGSKEGKVFTEPRPPYGFQGFTVFREDMEEEI